MSAPASGSSTQASVLYDTRLSDRRPNPALLNADTAWKTPSHAARRAGMS